MPEGDIVVPGPWKGKHAFWIPIARENIGRDVMDVKGDSLPLTPQGDSPMAFTDRDGLTSMLDEAFTTPGLLALTLVHEQTHFHQIITAGFGDMRTRSEFEVAAYKAEAAAMDKVGLTPDEREGVREYLYGVHDPNPRVKNINGQIDIWSDRVEEEKRTGRILFPWNDDAAAGQKSASSSRTNDVKSDVRKRFDELDGTVAGEIRFAKEMIRRQQEQEVFARQERQETMAEFHVKVKEATEQCGLEPEYDFDVHTNTYSIFVGYRTHEDNTRAYEFDAQTIDELRVNLMLTRTCDAISLRAATLVDPPCNDGIDILNKHANDEKFLAAIHANISLDVGGTSEKEYIFGCVSKKIKQIHFPLDFEQYKRLFSSDIKDNIKYWKRLEKEGKEGEKVSRRNAEIERSNRTNDSGGGGQATPRRNPAPNGGCFLAYPGGDGVPAVRMCPGQ
jgi:hypothetical protein